MRQISADHNTEEYGSKEEVLVLQYNLYGKVKKQYQYMWQEVDNNLCWYLPTEYTYYLAPPDAGAGNKINFLFAFYHYEWLWILLRLLPASIQQIFITQLLSKS